MVSVVLLLRRQLDLLPVADNQGHIVVFINPENICQALPKETEKTRGNTNISSFEVKHQVLLERQLPKYK
ncbi:hypothetical protein LC607_28520 [Nostoc sp. CHAB 5824]|nr:hypothetical protein [Nostoc sp. CHAB 5824]